MRVDRANSLSKEFSIWVGLNLMHNDIKVNTRHLFVAPSENVTKFLKNSFISDDFIIRTCGSNMNMDMSRGTVGEIVIGKSPCRHVNPLLDSRLLRPRQKGANIDH
jgi:hypothetical protein